MKIVHICLCSLYRDNWGYQENLLSKYNTLLGNDVTVISSNAPEHTPKNNEIKNPHKKIEYYIDGVKIIRVNSKFNILNKLIWYDGLYEILSQEKPDLIYMNGMQSLSIIEVRKYLKKNKNCKAVADIHADYFNSAQSFFSKYILHKIIWKYLIKYSINSFELIYCINNCSYKFALEMYNIPKQKMKLLYLGADVDKIDFQNKESIREKIRNELNIPAQAFVMITGGKINKDKRIHEIINAMDILNNNNLHLIVFGRIYDEFKDIINPLLNRKNIHYVGWITGKEVYDYYLASDIAIFAGDMSVLWQQAISCGLPAILRFWPGNEYLNEGNAIFLYSEELSELKQSIELITSLSEDKFNNMKDIAMKMGKDKFSYYIISNQIIDDLNKIKK